MLKQSTFDLFDTELFITETEHLLAIWESRSFSDSDKQAKANAWETLWKTFIENFFFLFINSVMQQSKRQNFLLYVPHICSLMVAERVAANRSAARLLRFLTALLTTACGKAA